MNSGTWIDLRSAIYGRRAVRLYKDTPMDRSTTEALAHAAIQAPSAMNRQPWVFAVVEGKERLKRLSDRVKLYLLPLSSPDFPISSPFHNHNVDCEHVRFETCFRRGPRYLPQVRDILSSVQP